jgi:hypothetical protein
MLCHIPHPTSHVSSCSEHAAGGVHYGCHVPLHAAYAEGLLCSPFCAISHASVRTHHLTAGPVELLGS